MKGIEAKVSIQVKPLKDLTSTKQLQHLFVLWSKTLFFRDVLILIQAQSLTDAALAQNQRPHLKTCLNYISINRKKF